MEPDFKEMPVEAGRGFTALRWRRPMALFAPLGLLAGSFGGVALLMEGLLMAQAKAFALVPLTLQQVVPSGIIMALVLGVTLLTLKGRELSMQNITGMAYLVGASLAFVLFLVLFALVQIGGVPPEVMGMVKQAKPIAGAIEENPTMLASLVFAAMFVWLLVQCFLSAVLMRHVGMTTQRD